MQGFRGLGLRGDAGKLTLLSSQKQSSLCMLRSFYDILYTYVWLSLFICRPIHICMHACMHVWMYGCMDAWMYGCMDIWMYGCMYVGM